MTPSEFREDVWCPENWNDWATVLWKNYDDTLSRFRTIPACHGQTDGRTDGGTDRRTELLYQYRASAAICWRAIKTNHYTYVTYRVYYFVCYTFFPVKPVSRQSYGMMIDDILASRSVCRRQTVTSSSRILTAVRRSATTAALCSTVFYTRVSNATVSNIQWLPVDQCFSLINLQVLSFRLVFFCFSPNMHDILLLLMHIILCCSLISCLYSVIITCIFLIYLFMYLFILLTYYSQTDHSAFSCEAMAHRVTCIIEMHKSWHSDWQTLNYTQ